MTERLPLVFIPGSPNTVQVLQAADKLAAAAFGLVGDPVGTTDVQTLTNKTITSPKINKLYAQNDQSDAVADLTGVASAVNRLTFSNNVAGQAPRINATGTDANIDLVLNTKGTGVAKQRIGGTLHTLADLDSAQVLANKALVAPNITDFTAMNHTHASAAQGGNLTASAFTIGAGVARTLSVASTPSSAIVNIGTTVTFDNFNYATTGNAVFGAVGATLRVNIAGKFSTTGTPTFRLIFKIASLGLLFDTGAKTCPVGVTDELFGATFLVVTRTIGASGVITCSMPVPLVLGANQYRFTQTTLSCNFVANGGVLDALTLQGQWGTASPSNSATLESVVIEALN